MARSICEKEKRNMAAFVFFQGQMGRQEVWELSEDSEKDIVQNLWSFEEK